MTSETQFAASSESPTSGTNVKRADVRPRAVEAEIRLFCQSCRLTPRETEVVLILAEGVTRIKDIAERLTLSPNTVNNHVNSIFLKTKTRSKSQLLAILLNRIAEDLHWARWLRQHPRVLFVLQSSLISTGNASNLIPTALERPEHLFRSKAITVAAEPDLKSFAKEVREYRPHFIVYEMKAGEGFDVVLREVSQIANVPTVLLTDGLTEGNVPDEARCLAMHDGAIELMAKSQVQTELVPLLMSHFIEEDAERWNFLETQALHTSAIQLRHSNRSLGEISTDQYGRGGFFLSAKDLQTIFDESVTSLAPISTGDWIEFGVDFGAGVKGQVRGQVTWMRKVDQGEQLAGAGVRVASLDAPLRTRFSSPEYSGKTSYIPKGLT